ncbi:hypothetical protein EKO04_011583 [Ascochyta lentis]|uniref:Arrestin-like N-terminal domain-containing protein n=1 Tax=Ascochyta lentis TaxID=205686 RepID=A0A8H7ISY2_9PLEO|nr:hypothetical protein EKO04_011583 [Ascochyta lentis]
MASSNDISVDIEVLACDKCSPHGNDYGCLRPGDSLEGLIRVSSPSALCFTDIEIFFQGLQSTLIRSAWAPNTNELGAYSPNYDHPVTTKSNYMFLDVSYQVKLDSTQRMLGEDGSFIYSFPFFFILPLGTEGLGASKPLLCRILPPTFRSKGLYSDPISVTYNLHGVVRYRNEQDASSGIPQTAQKVEKSKTIDFLPYTEVEPPTHVASFPKEFVLKTNSPIWKYALGGRLEEITMSTREPLPLAYSPYENRPYTALTLSITAHAPLAVQRLQAISLNVKPAIRVKMFYASEPMPCLPKQTFLTRNQSIRLHDEIIKLEHMGFTQLDWRYSPHIDTEEPPEYEDAVIDVALGRTPTSASRKDDSVDEWRASVRIPIQPDQTMLPTFCGSLISRSYSLILCVRVAGIRARKAGFEVPLQVVYLRPSQMRNDSVHDERSRSCIGPEGFRAQQDASPIVMHFSNLPTCIGAAYLPHAIAVRRSFMMMY